MRYWRAELSPQIESNEDDHFVSGFEDDEDEEDDLDEAED